MFKYHKKKNPFVYHLITGAGIVVFWRGVWGLLDLYLFPGNPLMSFITSIMIGLIILFLNDFSISELSE